MDYSEAGDRVGIGHESIGTTLDSVKFNGSLATDHAPDRPEALAGSAHCDEPRLHIGLNPYKTAGK